MTSSLERKRKRQSMRNPRVDEKNLPNALSRRLRHEGRFHDGVVEADSVEFPVHCDVLVTVSSFFEAAFTGPFTEGRTRRVKIADASSAAIDVILDYAYGADVLSLHGGDNLTSDVKCFDLVVEIMELSHRFFISDLLQRAATVVVKRAPVAKYVSAFQEMKKYDIADAEDAIFFKLAHSYNAILDGNHIVDLTNEEMCQLISSPELVAEEVAIFRGIVAWGKKNIQERATFMEGLLRKVRFQRFKQRDIFHVLRHQNILSKDLLGYVLEQCMYYPGLSVMNTRRYFNIDLGTIVTAECPPAWFAAYPMSYVDTVFRRMTDQDSRTSVFTIPVILTEDFLSPEYSRSFFLNYRTIAATISIVLLGQSLRFCLVVDRRLTEDRRLFNGCRVDREAQVPYLEQSVQGEFLLCRTRFVSDDRDPGVQHVQVWQFDEVMAKEDDVHDREQKAKRLCKESSRLVEIATVNDSWIGTQCTLFVWFQTTSREEFQRIDDATPPSIKDIHLGRSARRARRVGWYDVPNRY